MMKVRPEGAVNPERRLYEGELTRILSRQHGGSDDDRRNEQALHELGLSFAWRLAGPAEPGPYVNTSEFRCGPYFKA